jgi:outer membrane receptor protein involved in Fe transport
LSRDYLNPTAHRLLGASETTIFQADTAFSERKISQLLAPLSINNLDLAASQSSLDEFSPAYEREETRSTFDLTYGSANDLGAAEGLVTTRGERVGLGLAASSAQLKGSSSGNYRRDYRAGATLQWQPRWNHQFILSGDGQFIDQRDSGFEEQDLETKSNSAELSYRWTLTPELTLLANLSRLHDEEDGNGQGLFEDTFSTQIFEGIVDSLPNEIVGDRTRDSESTLSRGELQFVWQSSPLTSILHLDNSDQEVDEDDDLLILSDELGELTGNDIALASSSNTTLSGSTVSWYNTLHLTEWVDLTLGISHEDTELRLSQIPPFTNDTVRSNRTSPRLGILLTPDSDWTVRASYTEGLRKLSFEDQFSLEPTQVGGFSQRYNDLPGTENRTLGIGVDWRGTRGTYLGASFVHRDLIESSAEYAREFIVDFDLEQVSDRVFQTDRFDTHLDQRFVRGYLYQILTERLVGAIDYQFSQQEIFDPQTAEDLSDHDLAATLRYFAPNGVFLYLRGRYRDQEVSSPFEEAVNDDVPLVDLGAGYRLPRRRGIFTVELQNLFDEEITLRQFDGFQTPLSSGVGVRAQFTVQF